MPWLVKHHENPAERLFFVHVPRCGGTSLTQHFDVPRKSRQGRCCWWNFGMVYFFYRYHLLESANFPWRSWENLIAACSFTASMVLFIYGSAVLNARIPIAAYTLLASSLFMFTASTFIATAPIIGRIPFIRRCYLIVNHYVLLRFMESIEWCTGTNKTGYMMHLTMGKLLRYGYVGTDDLDSACTMAIVRNPYSRMVSVYLYNRYGPLESFPRFVRDWYRMMHNYRERRETEEWYTPCHAIPQFEFTHEDGKQIVQSVVKQEELKLLKTTDSSQAAIAADSSIADLPLPVRKALLGMPHANKRSSSKKWWEYYDQETLNLTYEMYKDDFLVFGYSPQLEVRPDLESPVPVAVKSYTPANLRNSTGVMPHLERIIMQRSDLLRPFSTIRGLAPVPPSGKWSVDRRSALPSNSPPVVDFPPLKFNSTSAVPRSEHELDSCADNEDNEFADTTAIPVIV
uniref:Sulfotransferase n=1 Tax=Tetraselmis chuii TaxID=63592 RepID=A0A7S1WZV2_9CHLO|mmetsp:Transcript_14395/g.25428  ORF Transcript_14395/g.25428 Transcript_14395/m.25428 type:complete len:457 (+) Transcript_14395:308-1678(+)